MGTVNRLWFAAQPSSCVEKQITARMLNCNEFLLLRKNTLWISCLTQ